LCDSRDKVVIMSHSPSAHRPRIVSASSRPPLRLRGWPAWGWLVLAIAGVATLAYEAYVLHWLAFGVSAEHPAPETVAAARDGARGLTLTVLIPWLVASIIVRPHLRMVVTGLVSATPPIWFWLEVSQMH
jgi:hypothetical protein